MVTPRKVKKKVVKKTDSKNTSAAKRKSELAKRKLLAAKRKAKNAKDTKRVQTINKKKLLGSSYNLSKKRSGDRATERMKLGIKLTKDQPKPKNFLGRTSASGSRKQASDALKKYDANKKIANKKEKSAILRSRKPKSVTQTAADKKRAKEKAAIKKYKKKG